MNAWKTQNVKVRLECHVKARGHEPHESSIEFPIAVADRVFTDRFDQVPGQAILGLRSPRANVHELFRIRPVVEFDFDADPQLKFVRGAFKIDFTSLNVQTGKSVVDTIHFSISRSRDYPVADLPGAQEWKFLLTREVDGNQPHFFLAQFRLGGPGGVDECRLLGCDEPQLSDAKRRECSINGCL